jgi:hypothetical protein
MQEWSGMEREVDKEVNGRWEFVNWDRVFYCTDRLNECIGECGIFLVTNETLIQKFNNFFSMFSIKTIHFLTLKFRFLLNF